MSVVRIDSARCNSYGWQARAYVAPGERLTRFFADQAHGGEFDSYRLALRAEGKLWREAARIRRQRRASMAQPTGGEQG